MHTSYIELLAELISNSTLSTNQKADSFPINCILATFPSTMYAHRYEIMCKCWERSPSERPTFAELRFHFEGLLEGQHASEYIAVSAPIADQEREKEGEMENEMAEGTYLPSYWQSLVALTICISTTYT